MLCLLPDQIKAFREALKDKALNVPELMKMSTTDRTALFEKYVGGEATKVNTLFEEKLILKNRVAGLKNWIAKVAEVGRYDPAKKAELERSLSDYRAKQQERIFSPKENEAFLNDLADKTLGIHISQDVAAQIFELSAKADALRNINPKMSGVSDEYLQAKNELNDYVAAQKNTSVIGSIGKNIATIGRNNLLANPSTPLKTAIGQVVNSAMDFVSRRIGARSLTGGNYDLVRQANSEAWATFRKTGVNTASMESLHDQALGKLGERQNFAAPAGAPKTHGAIGAVETAARKAAQLSNKIVIDWEHNYAFTKFYQKAFFDMTNLMSSSLAKDEGLLGIQAKSRAADIFKDAARIEPQTQAGAMVRLEAQKQAARVTSTNPTLMSRLSLGAKNWLNSVTPGFPLGDLLVPIAKIPANLISNGIENAGAGVPFAIRDIVRGYQKIQSEDLAEKYEGTAQFASGIQRAARIAGTLTIAAYLTSKLTPQDFKTDRYGKSYFRLGNTWINTEYIAAISPALAGMMEIKKTAKPNSNVLDKAGMYTSGALQSLKGAPGITEANDLVTAITNSNYSKGIMKYADQFFTQRGVPAFIPHLLSGQPIKQLFFSTTGLPDKAELKKLDAK